MKIKSFILGSLLLLGFTFLVGFSSPDNLKVTNPSSESIKKVALTFDDGPDKKYTNKVLDILKEHDVHATFFVVGKQVKLYPGTIKRISEEGHAIGNHSWDHKDFSKLSNDQMKQQIAKTDSVIKDAIGTTSAWFRAPYGAKNKLVNSVLAKTGKTHIGWTIDTRDWEGTSKEKMMMNVKKNLKHGGIILMHSFGGKGGKLDNTIELLPELITYLQEQEYTLVTIPELYEKE